MAQRPIENLNFCIKIDWNNQLFSVVFSGIVPVQLHFGRVLQACMSRFTSSNASISR